MLGRPRGQLSHLMGDFFPGMVLLVKEGSTQRSFAAEEQDVGGRLCGAAMLRTQKARLAWLGERLAQNDVSCPCFEPLNAISTSIKIHLQTLL